MIYGITYCPTGRPGWTHERGFRDLDEAIAAAHDRSAALHQTVDILSWTDGPESRYHYVGFVSADDECIDPTHTETTP